MYDIAIEVVGSQRALIEAVSSNTLTPQGGEASVSAEIILFEIGYFEELAATTAYDIVTQIPGFSLSEGDPARRGIADSAGNVLINGDRPSSKMLTLQSILERIAAADVVRVELITQPLPAYEMRGHSRLLNVITRTNRVGSGVIDASVRRYAADRVMPNATFSYTMPMRALTFIFGLELATEAPRFLRSRQYFAPDSMPLLAHDEADQRSLRSISPSWSITQEFNEGASLRFDGELSTWVFNSLQFTDVREPAGAIQSLTGYEQATTENHGDDASLSLSLNQQWRPTIRNELTFLWRQNRAEDGPEPFQVFSVDSGFQSATIVSLDYYAREEVLRDSVTWNVSPSIVARFGAEWARNLTKTNLQVSLDQAGQLSSIVIPNAFTIVSEERGEVFATLAWDVGDRWSVSGGLRAEASTISQSGGTNQMRRLEYLKPSVSLVWTRSQNDQLRVTVLRDVDQLDFSQFSTSVNVTDGSSSIGNPNYEPQQIWRAEGEWTHRWNDRASMRLLFGHDIVEDVDGWVPFSSGDRLFDAPGNIGSGDISRVNGDLSTSMTLFGLEHMTFDFEFDIQRARVRDPVTGEMRRFDQVPEYSLRAQFRQALPALNMAWGATYAWESSTYEYRLQETRRQGYYGPDLSAFVERSFSGGLRLQFGVEDLLGSHDKRVRQFYATTRNDSLTSTEVQHRERGATWYASLRQEF